MVGSGRADEIAAGITHDATFKQADLIESIAGALQYISYYHPADYISHLARAYEGEQSAAAKDAIAQILTNSRMCAEGKRPICQDTGIVNVFLKVGMDVRWDGFTGSLEDAVNEGVRRGYNNPDNLLRASIVDPPEFGRKNTGDNTPGRYQRPTGAGRQSRHHGCGKGWRIGEQEQVRDAQSERFDRRLGARKRCRRWVLAGVRLGCSASASAAPQKRRCCWRKNR